MVGVGADISEGLGAITDSVGVFHRQPQHPKIHSLKAQKRRKPMRKKRRANRT
jgi:hypothetical protein